MNQITRNIIFNVEKSSAENTVSIPKETTDTYRLAMHIAGIGAPKDLDDFTVTIKAIKPDGTEVQESCTVSGNTVYYVIQPQFTTVLGNVNCSLKISDSDETLYELNFRCIITDGGEVEEQYVTPEMYGAGEDSSTDDSAALQQAFNDGRNVIFLKDYYITGTINIVNKSNLKVYGNNHTVTVSSKEPTEGDRNVKSAFSIRNCNNISFQDLTIESVADQNLIAIESDTSGLPRIYTDHFQSSNVQGFKVQLTNDLSIRNYTSYNLHGDISLQTCTKVSISHWHSNNSLMGLYTSDTKGVSVSDFRIISDPENTIGRFHAFYLCRGTENIYISDGEAIFKNMWENVENVSYLNGDNSTTVTLRTPLFTIHGAAEDKWQKEIYVDNVKFTAQRIINVEKMAAAPVFSNCTFTTHYPENVTKRSEEGQLTLRWNTVFNNCTFNLGDIGIGLEWGDPGTAYHAIFLNNCTLHCSNTDSGTNFLLGYYGKFKLTNCFIDWPFYLRKTLGPAETEFYNCTIKLQSDKAVVAVSTTEKTETYIIDSFIESGYCVRYAFSSQESSLAIINSHLVSDNANWYQGTMSAFSESVRVFNSYHNDTKISTGSSDALTLHTVDPHAHVNIELDGNDSN